MLQKIKQRFFEWITYEEPNTDIPSCDFERIRYELRPGDVLLIEGRSRVSEVIRQITQSSWSHACLYVGRLHDVDNIELRNKLLEHYDGDPNVQFVIEGFLGKGTIVTPLEYYTTDNIRVCRPRGLSRDDAQKVIAKAINRLGSDYDVRQVFDLARFLVPWSVLPRRWRSTLFQFHTGESTRTVCSTMIAEAFAVIDFPILPVVKKHDETGIELFVRNPRILTPRDFDYSPYFDIIKFPFISYEQSPYKNLPWNRKGYYSPDGLTISNMTSERLASKTKVKIRVKPKKQKESVVSLEANKLSNYKNKPDENQLNIPETVEETQFIQLAERSNKISKIKVKRFRLMSFFSHYFF